MNEEHLYEEAGSVQPQRLETSLPCEAHVEHKPRSVENHRHHVWPLGMGGPDIPENIVVICPTGHANVHSLLRLYVANHGSPPPALLRLYGRAERRLALLGWQRYARKAME